MSVLTKAVSRPHFNKLHQCRARFKRPHIRIRGGEGACKVSLEEDPAHKGHVLLVALSEDYHSHITTRAGRAVKTPDKREP